MNLLSEDGHEIICRVTFFVCVAHDIAWLSRFSRFPRVGLPDALQCCGSSFWIRIRQTTSKTASPRNGWVLLFFPDCASNLASISRPATSTYFWICRALIFDFKMPLHPLRVPRPHTSFPCFSLSSPPLPVGFGALVARSVFRLLLALSSTAQSAKKIITFGDLTQAASC